MINEIPLSSIILDENYQPRKKLNSSVVEEYAQLIREGAEFPAVTVFKQEDSYILAAGFHRFESYKLLESKTIPCIVKEGSEKDIVLEAIESNTKHGARYTNEDKRKCIELVLNIDECRLWADNHIAKICGVSNHLVKSVRTELYPDSLKETEVIAERNGHKYVMNKPERIHSQESLEKSLNKKIVEIVDVLNIIKLSVTSSPQEIPIDIKAKIDEFVDWYTTLKEKQ